MGVPGGGVCSSQADQRKPQHLAGPRHHPSEREGGTRQTDNTRAYEELRREGCKLQRMEGECRLCMHRRHQKARTHTSLCLGCFFSQFLWKFLFFIFLYLPFTFFIHFIYVLFVRHHKLWVLSHF